MTTAQISPAAARTSATDPLNPTAPRNPAAARVGRPDRLAAEPVPEPELDFPVVVLVPAHDEERSIGATLDSILGQSRRPDRVVVVADNCSDRTAEIALAYGVEVLPTVGNRHRKAGALNFALDRLLPELSDDTRVMIMDADSTLTSEWIYHATAWLAARPQSGAVCAVYRGRAVDRVLPILQRMDFAQEARRVSRHGSRVDVLTGVASMFTAGLLRQIAAQRGTTFPGQPGVIYDIDSLTEDFEITLAIKAMGYDPVSPRSLVAETDVMENLSDLRRQRLRWQRGTVETLRSYGFTRLTRRYWRTQLLTYGLSLGLPIMITLLAIGWYLYGFSYQPLWLLVLPLFYAEHILLCWRMGGRARIVALTLLPFWLYENYRIFIFWSALARAVLRREKRWA